jgi:hypothetical protein
MNHIFTLLTCGLLCLVCKQTKAQTITFDFNTNTDIPATTECWTNNNFTFNNTKPPGPGPASGSLASKSNTATFTTPYIDLSAGQTIQFLYRLSSTSSTSYTYTLAVSLISLTGTTVAPSINVTSTTFTSYSYTVPVTGTYRVSINYITTAPNQFGQNFAEIDDLIISGSYHYSNPCNQAPSVAADTYNAVSFASPTVTGNVLDNDADPNNITDPGLAAKGEKLTITSFTTVASGNLIVNPDGTFSFTPNASFKGGVITFSYTASDNGYSPFTATTTVTINYPTAPTAIDDSFGGPISGAGFSSNVASNDLAPSGKVLVTNLVAGPSSGQVVLQSDGSFTYTPPAGFTGGDVTFTYNVTYDTYMPLNSNTATVTINYPALTPTPLPIKLLSFTGQVSNNQAVLRWSVDDNETGNYFKVERSVDGKNFTEAAIVLTSGTKGKQEYSFSEAIHLGTGVYYRLQIVNIDAPPAYSKTVILKPQIAATSASIHLATNPVQARLRFTFSADQAEQAYVHIYSINGIEIMTKQLTTVKGINAMELETTYLAKGQYILEVRSKTATQRTRFIK